MDLLSIVAVSRWIYNSRPLSIWCSNMYLVCLSKTNMQNYRVAVLALCLESVNMNCAFVYAIKYEYQRVRKPGFHIHFTGPCMIKRDSECTGAQNVLLNFQFCIWMLFHSTETTSVMTSYPTDYHLPRNKAKYENQKIYQRINIKRKIWKERNFEMELNTSCAVNDLVKKSTWSFPICLDDNTKGSDR